MFVSNRAVAISIGAGAGFHPIGHNTVVVYVKGRSARAVLCGSTNWTANALCAHSNNALIIESPKIETVTPRAQTAGRPGRLIKRGAVLLCRQH